MTPSENMFKELNWLTFSNQVTFHDCIMMYKTLNNLAPTYLTEMFTSTSKVHDRGLRSIEKRHLESLIRELNIMKTLLQLVVPTSGNSLPLELRQTYTLGSFK